MSWTQILAPPLPNTSGRASPLLADFWAEKNGEDKSVCAQSLGHVQLFAIRWTVALQAPLSMAFFRQEYWSGLPFPLQWNIFYSRGYSRSRDRAHLLGLLHWQADSLPLYYLGDQSWVFIGRTDAEAETPNTLATSSEELTHWKRPWCWEGLGAGGEGDDRGWDGWMASPTQ